MDDVIELAYGKQLTLKEAAWKSCFKDPSEVVHRFHCNNKPCACCDSESYAIVNVTTSQQYTS